MLFNNLYKYPYTLNAVRMAVAETKEAAKTSTEGLPLDDKVVVMCLHQFARPARISNMVPPDAIPTDHPDGYGNCEVCTYDGNNGYCKGYSPIKVQTFYVHDADA